MTGLMHAAARRAVVWSVVLLAVAPSGHAQLATELVASGLALPVGVASMPGDGRLFVLEQNTGRVRVVKDGVVQAEPYLDVSADFISGSERGLLGLAFHPRYGTSGYVYVYYNEASGASRLERYQVDANDPDRVDPTSAQILLVIDQPFTQHNGGALHFGPHDGFLYLTVGDGGDGGDPFNNAQDPSTLLGSILRLDVDGGSPYAIPPGNPFVGVPGAREEVWALGVRNPWRAGFDSRTGDLYLGDVGQQNREEISVIIETSPPGQNLGWRCLEGTLCTLLPGCGPCPEDGMLDPVYEYDHNQGCAIVGGEVYRAGNIPGLDGTYFFADYCSGDVWSFRLVHGRVTEFATRTAELIPPGETSLGLISSFGRDSDGAILIVSHLSGEIYRIIEAPDLADCDQDGTPDSVELSAGTAFDVNGNGLPDDCELDLSIDDLAPGQTSTFQFVGAEPGLPTAWWWTTRGIGASTACFFGDTVCLDLLQPIKLLAIIPASAQGSVTFDVELLPGLIGVDVGLSFQVLIIDGFDSKVSNPVQKILDL